MSVPNLFSLAKSVFEAFPADVAELRQTCDETDALRDAKGEDDPGVQAGERKANNLKGLFTRRIAYACSLHDARFGLRRKDIGQHATRPADGVNHSTDALMMRDDGQIIDAMSDRDVTWGVTPGDTQPLDQWLAPLPEDVPAQPPTPIPAPVDPPLIPFDLAARVDVLETQSAAMAEHLSNAIDALNAQGRALTDYQLRLKQLEDKSNAPGQVFELPKLVAVGRVPFIGAIRLPVEKA